MLNKRKIKVVAGDWIYDLCGYFCCTDMLLMSMCRIAALNNHLHCVVWVSLRCHGLDYSSKDWAVILVCKTNLDSTKMRGSEQTAVSKQRRAVFCPSSLLPSHSDSACRQRIQYWMSSQAQSWNLREWSVSCHTALSWFDHYRNM